MISGYWRNPSCIRRRRKGSFFFKKGGFFRLCYCCGDGIFFLVLQLLFLRSIPNIWRIKTTKNHSTEGKILFFTYQEKYRQWGVFARATSVAFFSHEGPQPIFGFIHSNRCRVISRGDVGFSTWNGKLTIGVCWQANLLTSWILLTSQILFLFISAVNH